MIFLDTSAIYALADIADSNHETAVSRFQAVLLRGEELLTHNYVLTESISLLQARLGIAAAARFAKDSSEFVVDWIDEELHLRGCREMTNSRKRRVSFVDHISFLVMRRRGLSTAFSFDPDFKAAGFRLL